ncbi:MAG: hypothetical protein HPY61_00450 [Methanotrichaceae archaeon]|nr:hypothetical protein [Methanotrichaceae archaeon]
MDTMEDLLNKVREFASQDLSKEEAQRLFGWEVKDVTVRATEKDETEVNVLFDNNMILHIRYFLNLDPTETNDTCEFTLALKTDLRSRIKYSVHYSGYIHGQGYLRLKIAEFENRMLQRMLEDFYVPALRTIYKPIIERFKGFFSKDYFGVDADSSSGIIYYSPVRNRSEQKDVKIWDVVSRLHELDALLRNEKLRHQLAELDLQLSLLPSVMWSDV